MHQDESVYSKSTLYIINIKLDVKCALWVALCLGIQEQNVPVVHASVCHPAPTALQFILSVQCSGYNSGYNAVSFFTLTQVLSNYHLIYFIGLVPVQYQISWLRSFKQAIFFCSVGRLLFLSPFQRFSVWSLLTLFSANSKPVRFLTSDGEDLLPA